MSQPDKNVMFPMLNDALNIAVKAGIANDAKPARDGYSPEFTNALTRAEAAEAEAKRLRALLKPTINEKMEKKLRSWAEAMQAASSTEGTALGILLDNNAKRRTALEASR